MKLADTVLRSRRNCCAARWNQALVSLLLGCLAAALSCNAGVVPSTPQVEEATEYLGTKLTPIAQQGNNALKGTQHLDRTTYRLLVEGLVEQSLSLSYDDLLALPAESRLTDLNCVEGWNFTAKWTGPTLASILGRAKPKPGVRTVVFHTSDASGYTSLDFNYTMEKSIIIALRLNDVTLPADRGFPFQVVAESKFGYKWAKWVTSIELTDGDFRGYWEQRGFNNDADIAGPKRP